MESKRIKKIKMFYKINLCKRFTNFLIKKGKKVKAYKILKNVFIILSNRFKKIIYNYSIFFRFFFNLDTFVESRRVKSKNQMYFIPILLTKKRKVYLILSWLTKITTHNSLKMSISIKIALEFYLVLLKSSFSKCIFLKNMNNKNVLQNRSKMHYRW